MKMTVKEATLQEINTNPGTTTRSISENTGRNIDSIRKACSQLVKEGKVTKEQVEGSKVKQFLFSPVTEETTSRDELISKAKESSKTSGDKRRRRGPKNRAKIIYDRELLGKAKLVNRVVQVYVKNNPEATYEEIANVFNYGGEPELRLNTQYDIVRPKTDPKVQMSYTGSYKRYNTKNTFVSADGIEFLTSTEWGADNINEKFIAPVCNAKLGLNLPFYE